MASLSSPGVGTGFDVSGTVTQLVEAERKGFDDRYEASQVKFTEQISGIGKLKSATSDLEANLFDLKLSTTFSKRKVTSDSTNFTATAGSAALPADYDVRVDRIAKSQKITTQAFDPSVAFGKGDITIGYANGDNVTLSISDTDTLAEIQSKINEASETAKLGITATMVTGDNGTHLVFNSEKFGDDSVMQIVIADDDGLNHDGAGLSRLGFSSTQTTVQTGFTAGETMNSNGQITLNVGSDSAAIAVTATDTIEDMRDKINASGLDVTASLEDDGVGGFKLVLDTGKAYGDHQISMTIDTDDDGDITDGNGLSRLAHDYSPTNYSENQAASNAQITINGGIAVTSSSNVFADAIKGVEIVATKVHDAGESDAIKVELDEETIKEKLVEFVEKFNGVVDVVNELTVSTGQVDSAGPLVGDSTLRTMMSHFRNRLSESVEVAPQQFLSLSMLGIETQKDGSLKLDQEKLDNQISANFDKFGELFAGENGLGKSLHSIVNDYETTEGILDTKTDSINNSIKRLDEEKTSFDQKMIKYEQRLLQQFSSMDLLVAQLNSTGDYLKAQLDALAGVSSKK
ncbi:flagellar filament capping protein FliD [Flocculibacter collagenilyticus]|uniref:flagellar filament capping protein FliD n=1 Tax=Flocculibacter collagenilyticus TaxID=2744479 RepID=UPI0018F3F30F|nr:flagellar filament capping protein FliD [Flocculibacter collagenilyticus]